MYAVLGVTGNTGSAALERLLAKGAKVRAIVRDPARVAGLSGRGVEIAKADVDDTTALTAALRGVDGAYVLVPPPYGAPDFMGTIRKTATSIADAVAAAGVPHIVALSSVGAHMPSGNGAIGSLTLFERLLAEKGLARTILRPAYFMQNWGNVAGLAKEQGILPSMLQPVTKAQPMVSTADIGHLAADLLTEPVTGARVVNLAGPQDYSPADVAAALSTLFGKQIQAVEPPEAAWQQILVEAGLSQEYAAGLVEMYRGLNAGTIGPESGAEIRRGTTTLTDTLKAFA